MAELKLEKLDFPRQTVVVQEQQLIDREVNPSVPRDACEYLDFLEQLPPSLEELYRITVPKKPFVWAR